jgi:hypothetical protein
MTPNDFRQHGKALIDWIAGHREHIGQNPTLALRPLPSRTAYVMISPEIRASGRLE